jgi:O-antigen/teichoic acid export membrane protein
MLKINNKKLVIKNKIWNIQKELPEKNEQTIFTNYWAGYYGFIATIWSAVFGPIIINLLFGYELEGGRISALVVIVSAFLFVISYLYLY